MTTLSSRRFNRLSMTAAAALATVGLTPALAQQTAAPTMKPMTAAPTASSAPATATPPATTAAPAAPAAATPAASVVAPTVAPGQAVFDASGAAVGTVESVSGGNAVVKTDKYPIAIPVASFAPSNGKLAVGSTQVQLNAEYEKALAAAKASIVVGANVNGSDGATVGTISKLDADSATIKLASGGLVRVERSALAADAKGAVVGATAAELDKQAQPATAKKATTKKK